MWVNCEWTARDLRATQLRSFNPAIPAPQWNKRDNPGQNLRTQRHKRDYPGQNLSTFSWSPPFTPLLNDGSRWKRNNFYYNFRLEAASLKAGVQGAYKEVPSFVPCRDDEPSTCWDNESSTSWGQVQGDHFFALHLSVSPSQTQT